MESEGRRWRSTNQSYSPSTCSASGLSRAAPRPAARAQRRCRARNNAKGAAPGRAQCRCTKNRGRRGAAAAPEGRTWPPTAPALGCQRGLPCCSTPRCSCPAAPPCAEQSPGSCPRCFLVPLHQEPGSERSSSRTRGTHLASDGPNLQHPRGLSRCSTPRCSCPATPPCAEQSPGRYGLGLGLGRLGLGPGLGHQLSNGPPHGTPGKLRIRNRGFLEGTIPIGTAQKSWAAFA